MASPYPGLTRHPKSGIFWIKRRVPTALLAQLPRPMVIESLGTRDARTAETLYLERMAEVTRIWTALSVGRETLSRRTISALAGEFYREIVARFQDDPGEPEQWEAEIAKVEQLRRMPRRPHNPHGNLQEEMNVFLEARGVPYDASTSIVPLLQTFAEARLLAYRHVERMARGDYSPEPAAARFPAWEKPANPAQPIRRSAQTLSVAADWALFVKERDLSVGTAKRWRPLLLHLSRFIGDDNLATATPQQIVAWTRELAKADASGKALSPITISGAYLAAARSFFAWAKSSQALDRNPCDDVKVKVPIKGDADEDKGFDDEQAARILSETLRPADPRSSKFMAAAKRWVPWICAYTGARVNEVTQMRKEDVRAEKSGNTVIWVLRITPEAGTVKNRSKRDVPLHPHLVEQGFHAFVASSSDGPLFYNSARPKNGSEANPPYRKIGDKLAAWVRDIGIDGDVAPNHGWRHRFISTGRDVRMRDETRDRITGHAATSESKKYGSHLLRVKYREICQIPKFDVVAPSGPRERTASAVRRNQARQATASRAKNRTLKPAIEAPGIVKAVTPSRPSQGTIEVLEKGYQPYWDEPSFGWEDDVPSDLVSLKSKRAGPVKRPREA